MSDPQVLPAAETPDDMLTCARLKKWVLAAQPNARLVYGYGRHLAEACTPQLKTYVLSLYERGYLTPHFVRGPGGNPPNHIVQRTRQPIVEGAVL